MSDEPEATIPSGRGIKIKLAVGFVLLFALCGGGMYVLQPTPCERLANVVCPGESPECAALKTALEEWGDPHSCERWADEMAFDELRAQFDLRLWMGTIPFPVGFFLMGLEFLRFAFTRDTMHAGIAGIASDRIELEEHQRDLARER